MTPGVFTNRELQVVQALARGERPRDIAKSLGLHKNTVNCYQTRALQKLGLHTRHQLVRDTLARDRESGASAADIGPQGVSDSERNPTTTSCFMEGAA